MQPDRIPLTGLALALLPSLAAAQGVPRPLVLEGDVVPGVGSVTRIDDLAIVDGGGWVVLALTDHPDPQADSVLLQDGAVLLREGQPLAAPAGARIDAFGPLVLGPGGELASILLLQGSVSSGDDTGLFVGSRLVLREGDPATAVGFGVGATYLGFDDLRFNRAGEILFTARVDDPTVTGAEDSALVRATVDPAGLLLASEVVHLEGELLPGQTQPLQQFETTPHALDLSALGEGLFIASLAGSIASNEVVYQGGALLAQKGDPAPVPGRSWQGFGSGAQVALNVRGDHVFTGTLDGPTAGNQLMVRNGTKLFQEGDVLPAFAPHSLLDFGFSVPIDLDARANVLWHGRWSDPDLSRNRGLLWNDVLLVQMGVTRIRGLTVESLPILPDAFALSDDGRWVLFEATLEDGLDGAFVLDLGA